jgi:recombinational DNA repair protein (RecF pathway)
MTAAHGRHLGLVRGGSSRKVTPLLQAGNSVRAVWRARLHEHLGSYVLEATRVRSDRLMGSAAASYGMQTIAAHLRLLPERDPHLGLHRALEMMLDHIDDPAIAGALLVRFELALLAELGFGLDLESCAATGGRDLIGLAEIWPRRFAGRRRAMEGTALAAAAIPDRRPGIGERARNRRRLRAHRLLPGAAGVRAARAGNSRVARGAAGARAAAA